jgi:hypothetical protein
MTDKLGAYFFLVPQGQYVVESLKNGYSQIVQQKTSEQVTHYQGDYLGGVLNIQDPDLVDSNIPMRKEGSSFLRSLFQRTSMKAFMDLIFWAMFVFNIYALVISPSLTNLLIVVLYALLAVILNFSMIKSRWGTVRDSEGKSKPFTTVEIVSSNGSKVARAITDDYGRYLIILNSGYYRIEARGVNGVGYAEKNIALPGLSAVHEDLVLS